MGRSALDGMSYLSPDECEEIKEEEEEEEKR